MNLLTRFFSNTKVKYDVMNKLMSEIEARDDELQNQINVRVTDTELTEFAQTVNTELLERDARLDEINLKNIQFESKNTEQDLEIGKRVLQTAYDLKMTALETKNTEQDNAISNKVNNSTFTAAKTALETADTNLQADINTRVQKTAYATDKAALENAIAAKTTTSLNGTQANVNFIGSNGVVTQLNANGTVYNLQGQKGDKGDAGTASTAIDDTVTNLTQTWTSGKINSLLDDVRQHIDYNKTNKTLTKIHDMITKKYNQELATLQYIMVGDSTRASNGAHIYTIVGKRLRDFGVETILQAQSGLKAKHWGYSDTTIQTGYPQAKDLIEKISGDGSNTIVDICLGLNDSVDDIDIYIKAGIDIIKASKPNITINITSPNITTYNATYISKYYNLVNNNDFGFIDVFNNVFKTQADMTGLFLDSTHPNELGQKKMAYYILSKLIPANLTQAIKYRIPQGYLENTSSNEAILKSGFRCEVVYTEGATTGSLYLKKISSKYYLYDVTSGNALTGAITLENGLNILTEKGYVTGRKIIALIYIADASVLINSTDVTTYYSIKNAVVTEFTDYKATQDLLIKSLDNTENYSFMVRKGVLKNDVINNPIKASKLSAEVIYSAGTPAGTLYLNKQAGNKLWCIHETIGGSAISEVKSLVQGDNNFANGYVSGKTITAKIYVEDISVLNNIAGNDTIYYPITQSAVVTEYTTKQKTIKEHIYELYRLVSQ